MHIEILVEELSTEVTLKNLLPHLLTREMTYRIINFQGKQNLLRELPARLRGYSSWITDDYRIVVLLDEDRQNCLDLKQQMELAASRAGLTTKTSAGGTRFQVLNRIVIEELEAWFIGDFQAMRQAYPRLPETLPPRLGNPDTVAGGTWETLEKFMRSYGYFQGGYPKVEAARAISTRMNPANNTSRSFQVFWDGLLSMIS